MGFWLWVHDWLLSFFVLYYLFCIYFGYVGGGFIYFCFLFYNFESRCWVVGSMSFTVMWCTLRWISPLRFATVEMTSSEGMVVPLLVISTGENL